MIAGASFTGRVGAAQDNSPQDFTLFEEIERAESATGTAGATSVARESRATTAQPVFTLVGTTRIGDRRSAIVKHMSGEEIAVRLEEGLTPIPDHTAYAIVELDGRSLGIRYPGNVPCESFAEQGVRCEGNVARLSLTNAAPLAQTAAEAEPENAEQAAQEAGETDSRNPFEVIRERARAGQQVVGDPAESRRFQPRRIDPADVPPGYRVVSTPFGDRLVEE